MQVGIIDMYLSIYCYGKKTVDEAIGKYGFVRKKGVCHENLGIF